MLRVIGFVMMLCAGLAFGDGLPVEDGKIVVEHTMLDLTKSQAEEVESSDTLTLTDEQWRKLQKVGPACPKRFHSILPIDHNDCTCGFSDYAILVSPRKAAILHWFVHEDRLDELDQLFSFSKKSIYDGSRWEELYGESITIDVDEKGQLFLAGTLIPYEKLRSVLQLPQMTPYPTYPPRQIENTRTVVFKLDNGVTASDVVLTKTWELEMIAEGNGWKVNLEPERAWGVRGENLSHD